MKMLMRPRSRRHRENHEGEIREPNRRRKWKQHHHVTLEKLFQWYGCVFCFHCRLCLLRSIISTWPPRTKIAELRCGGVWSVCHLKLK